MSIAQGLYVDNLGAAYPNFLVSIVCGNSSSGITEIQGILTDEEFDLDNDADLEDADVSMLGNFIKGGAEAAGNAVSRVVGSALAKKFNSMIQSSKDWNGGSKLSFSVSFNVFRGAKGSISGTPSFNAFYSNLVKLTQSAEDNPVLPQKSFYDSIQDRLTDVNQIAAKESNLFTCTIGSWFKARILIPTKTSMKLSTYTDTTGSPIFAKVTISFESYRVLSASEWAAIITDQGGSL
jgi:hypothetical protein